MTTTLQKVETQVAVARESTPGTWETSLDTDATTTPLADFVVGTPQINLDPVLVGRQILLPHHVGVRPFAPARDRPGRSPTPVTVTFSAFLAGHEDNDGTAHAVEPPIARLLSACGCLSAAVRRYPVSAWSDSLSDVILNQEAVSGSGGGSFQALSFGPSAADVNDAAWLLASTLTGTATPGETLTGAKNGASATAGTLETYNGWGLVPLSDEDVTSTVSILFLAEGRQFKIRGARGTATITWPHTRKAVAAFTFLGTLEEDPSDRGNLSGDDLPAALHHVGPTCRALGFDWDDQPGGSDPHAAPTFSQVSLELGVEPALHVDANDPDFYSHAHIASRTPRLQIDVDERTGQVLERAYERGHAWHHSWSLGDSAGNIWETRIPAAWITARIPIQRGDRRAVRYTFDLGAAMSEEDNFSTVSRNQRPIAPDGEFVLLNR